MSISEKIWYNVSYHTNKIRGIRYAQFLLYRKVTRIARGFDQKGQWHERKLWDLYWTAAKTVCSPYPDHILFYFTEIKIGHNTTISLLSFSSVNSYVSDNFIWLSRYTKILFSSWWFFNEYSETIAFSKYAVTIRFIFSSLTVKVVQSTLKSL